MARRAKVILSGGQYTKKLLNLLMKREQIQKLFCLPRVSDLVLNLGFDS